MAENKPLAYHEPKSGFIYRPYMLEGPRVYERDNTLIERINRGEHVSEQEAFSSYFSRIEAQDPVYMQFVRDIAGGRAARFPESIAALQERKLQIIVPAYREGENISHFLENIRNQFDQSSNDDWGVTFVIDYATPYANTSENTAREEMHHAIAQFLERYPQYRSRIDWIYYVRNKNMDPPVLPVGLARKVGEDILMYERLEALKQRDERDNTTLRPFYLGLMDIDTMDLSEGLLDEMVNATASSDRDIPRVIRAKGSFDSEGIKRSPHLLPLQLMWEGITSEVGRTTQHNPFNIGRLSAVPARELAVTGGGFTKRLSFTDEDIRHGIQIAWVLNDIKVVEPEGQYATSPRREVHTMDGVRQLVRNHGGSFDMETLGVAALIRMYGNWVNETFRDHLGNGNGEENGAHDVFSSNQEFSQAVPSKLIEVMTNAFYRFTAFSIYAIDELSQSSLAPEIQELREKFLRGEIAYFDVQLQTMDFIRKAAQDPERFKNLMPLLEKVDKKAKAAVSNVLRHNGINFSLDDTSPIYGLLELNEQPESSIYALLGLNGDTATSGDRIVLRAPFHIFPEQPGFLASSKRQIQD